MYKGSFQDSETGDIMSGRTVPFDQSTTKIQHLKIHCDLGIKVNGKNLQHVTLGHLDL